MFQRNFLFKLTLAFTCCSAFVCAQHKHTIDSLYHELSIEKSDTVKCILLADLSNYLSETLHDSAFSMATTCYEIAKESNYKFGKGKALFCMALVRQSQGKYNDALNYLKQAETIFIEGGHKKELASTYNTMGLGYLAKTEFPEAIGNFFKAVKKYEEAKDIKGQAIANGNVGLLYYNEGNFDKALEYFTLAMNIDKSVKNEAGAARHIGNIANVYYEKGKILTQKGDVKAARDLFNKAYNFYNEAYQTEERRNNKSGMARQIGNIANVFNSLGDTAKTTEYYNKAYKIFEEMGDKINMSRQMGNIGWGFAEKKEYKRAEAYTLKAIELIKNTTALDVLYNWYDNLSYIYEEAGNYKEAHETYKQFIILRDSLFSIDKARKTLEAQLNFEFDKKEALTKEEQAKQAIIRNAFIAGFALMFLMAIIVFRGYRNKQKANKTISEQKELVELKNKEITDSIRYAKRIQNAHLPSNEYITKKITELKNKS